jgi:hypothetical protein
MTEIAVIAEVVAAHRVRPAIMASPGGARYGEGFHASCSCGFKGEGKGKHLNSGQADANRESAQADADAHVAEHIAAALRDA